MNDLKKTDRELVFRVPFGVNGKIELIRKLAEGSVRFKVWGCDGDGTFRLCPEEIEALIKELELLRRAGRDGSV